MLIPVRVLLCNTEYKGKGTLLSKSRELGGVCKSSSGLCSWGSFLPKVGAQSLVVLSVFRGINDATTGALWKAGNFRSYWGNLNTLKSRVWPFYRAFLCSLNIPVQSFEHCCHENDM